MKRLMFILLLMLCVGCGEKEVDKNKKNVPTTTIQLSEFNELKENVMRLEGKMYEIENLFVIHYGYSWLGTYINTYGAESEVLDAILKSMGKEIVYPKSEPDKVILRGIKK